MRVSIFIIPFFTLIFTATCSAVSPAVLQYSHFAPSFEVDPTGNVEVEVNGKHQIKNAIQLQHLSTLHTRDFFSDLIQATLDMTPRQLLVKLETTFKDLDSVTSQGIDQLKDVYDKASPDIIKELEAIKNDAIGKVMEMIDEFLTDLDTVLPALSSQFAIHDSSASDIVSALLGKTLEELVTAMANALNRSLQLLDSTIASFLNLAAKATPEVGAILTKVVNQYLNRGRSIIIPMLDLLRQLVDIRPALLIQAKITEAIRDDDLLNGIVSTILGVDIKEAAWNADSVLSQLIPLFETTRSSLDAALNDGNASHSEVHEEVMSIYNKAVDDVIRNMKPVVSVLLLFQENSRREKTFIYDLTVNLFGIGTDTFSVYLNSAAKRAEKTIKNASVKIIHTSMKAGILSFLKVSNIVYKSLRSAKNIAKPLSDTLNSIREHIENGQTNISKRGRSEEMWSDSEGCSYNRDDLIDSASTILGFEVAEATTVLKTALESLDELTDSSLREFQSILDESDAELSRDILQIMNETLTAVHITLQPMLDVLLPFLPDPLRSNKQIQMDIFAATNEVNLAQFMNYCSTVVRKIPAITDLATIRIEIRAARAGPTVHGKISSLLRSTDYHTRSIIQPFLDILGPVISPRS